MANSTQTALIIIIGGLLIYTTHANYCLCEDIISMEVCNSETTYDGICQWRNGKCYELTCPERRNLKSCEPQFGFYYCGWINDSECVDPEACEDFAVRKWCLNAGCAWVPGDVNTDIYSTNGACIGEIGAIQCRNLNQEACRNLGYIFDVYTYTYNLCYLNKDGQCNTYKTCSLISSEYDCDPTHCKWNNQLQQCFVRLCSDMTTQDGCMAIGGDDQTAFLCEWDSKKNLCITTSCDQITGTPINPQKSRCNHQTEGYGTFCYWNDSANECKAFSCADQTDKDICLHQTLMEGGVSTCTWATNPNTKQGQCYGCDVIQTLLLTAR